MANLQGRSGDGNSGPFSVIGRLQGRHRHNLVHLLALHKMSKSTKRPNKLVDNVGHPSGSEEEPIDTGLIRCICNSADDDGFTIQCERCLVWQHAFCVNITQTNIPEQYFCDQCTGQRPDAATKGRKPMDHSPSNSRRPVVEKGKHGSRPPLVGKRKESSKSLERIKPSSVNSLDDVPVDMPSDWFSPTDLDSPPVKSPRPRKGSFGTMLIKGRHAQQIIMETRDKWMKLPRWTGPLFHNDRADPLRHSLMSGLYNTMNSNTMANTISKLAVQSIPQQQQQDQLGLFASREIKADTYLMEVTGTVMLKSEYKYDPDNLYGFLGTPLPKVFFYPFLNVCIDARDQGNDVRHIRRSCFPNAEVKNIVLPYSREDTIHLGLFSRQPIQPGDEITIGWNWQHGHVAWKKYQEQVASDGHGHHHVIDEQGMRKNRQTLQRMLQCWETTFARLPSPVPLLWNTMTLL
ncbi:uncharacterized protein BYT42DRAFT_59647 [Radiomyces spectabilis]|uniref:uncharacterized protein n=1 Tax=Radiomyces spectabilis TaxID=64574 RepID=UPI0022209ED0|nr:uncharacterized protein BYT42DRAFT_59647 [Radiomyces spectabilis]KAI8373146.1 hypothetical protein BYT42DRAFT_59647 [Radiomyces spectabilis]